MINSPLVYKYLGLQPYPAIWQEMKDFTDRRTENTHDEIWFLEHPAVFTQGQAGKPEHILNAGNIPVIQTDRGGQVTYHGPGQLVVYFLLDVRRRHMGVRALVTLIEESIITLLSAHFGIPAYARQDAPGVYINQAKIASLGLRIRHGCSYHGLAFNIDMDLSPFARINPCGFQNLAVTRLIDYIPDITVAKVIPLLEKRLTENLQSV